MAGYSQSIIARVVLSLLVIELIYNLYNPALVKSTYARLDQYLLSSWVNIVTKTLGCLLHLCALVARRMNTGFSSQKQKLCNKEFVNNIAAHFCLLLHLLRNALSKKPPGHELQMLYCGLVELSCCFQRQFVLLYIAHLLFVTPQQQRNGLWLV